MPDFNPNDIKLAFMVNNTKINDMPFPNKNGGHTGESVTCEGNVTASWDNNTWGLININNPDNVSKIKCTINFTSYKEELLNGIDPVLTDELVPIIINDNGKAIKANPDVKWYSYGNKEWANAVILTDDGKNKSFVNGAEIPEEYIESYFVWIPKYSYQLFDLGDYPSIGKDELADNSRAINIKFGTMDTKDGEINECTTPNKSKNIGNCKLGNYMTHPAFISFGVNGLWVGKYKVGIDSTNSNKTLIKPNLDLKKVSGSFTAYQESFNYKREKLDSHLIKNTEWGAIAYLTSSIYGKCNGGVCENLTELYTYKTGSPITVSTTGNYTGIYDMSMASPEYVMALTADKNGEPIYTSGFTIENFPKDSKYYDMFVYGETWDMNRGILGDATSELGPFSEIGGNHSSWYKKSIAYFPSATYAFIIRGKGNLYSFERIPNDTSASYSFRIVLAVK